MNRDAEISVVELKNTFEIEQYERREVAWAQRFNLLDNDGHNYEGTLRWHEDDGYSVNWYGAMPPEAFRPEFEYSLDSIMIGEKNDTVTSSSE